MSSYMYTIGRSNRTISIKSQSNDFVIGFKNVLHARQTIYCMHPDVDIKLYRGIPYPQKFDITAYPSTLLYVRKMKGDFMDPMNDGGFHMNTIKEEEYVDILTKTDMGLLMPHSLVNEDDIEMVWSCHLIEMR